MLILALPLAGALSAVPLKTAKTWGPKTFVPVWKSKFDGVFVLNRRVVLHAIDATPARWRGDAGHPTHWLISTQVPADATRWSGS